VRIIRDSDTVEYVDESGDKLVLLSAPRQRDVESSDLIERDEAMGQMQALKKSGIDTDAFMADAKKDRDALEAAKEAVKTSLPAAKVREFRLKSLGIRLVIGGENIGGEAIVTSYRDMDPISAAWIDKCVGETWMGALPSDEDTRGEGADAPVPVGATVSTPA